MSSTAGKDALRAAGKAGLLPDWVTCGEDIYNSNLPEHVKQSLWDEYHRALNKAYPKAGDEVFDPTEKGTKIPVSPAGHNCDYCSATGRVLPFVGEEITCPKCKGAGRKITEIALKRQRGGTVDGRTGPSWLIGLGQGKTVKAKDIIRNIGDRINNRGDWWIK